MTKVKELQDIYHEWAELHPGQDLDMRQVAAWAIAEKRWRPPPYDLTKACAKELSVAAREEYYTDPQGREVRRRRVRWRPDGGRGIGRSRRGGRRDAPRLHGPEREPDRRADRGHREVTGPRLPAGSRSGSDIGLRASGTRA